MSLVFVDWPMCSTFSVGFESVEVNPLDFFARKVRCPQKVENGDLSNSWIVHGILHVDSLEVWKFAAENMRDSKGSRLVLQPAFFRGKLSITWPIVLVALLNFGRRFLRPMILSWMMLIFFLILCHPLDPATGYQIMDASFLFFSIHN